MLSRIHSVGVRGVEGYPVLVELDLANGLPGYTTVGLPDSAVKESRERVISAVRNSGYKFPPRRVTVNLAPGQSRKEGSHYDLPIALAVLCASEQLPAEVWPGRWCFVGELALDGSLRAVRGVVAMAAKAREAGFEAIVVPAENAGEARAAGMNVVACRTLKEAVDAVCGRLPSPSVSFRSLPFPSEGPAPDLSEVKGQSVAKRALEIAAAGGHNLLFIGTPGVGKSMLARRLPGLLPPLSQGEALELARVQSSIDPKAGFPSARPFRAPHHTCSAAALVGGGPAGRPGEASLAHAGVLFLDEMAEFARPSLEALRQPLEEGRIVVSRAKETLAYPARFSLVAATNPCPCGWRGHPTRECRCTPNAVTKYLSRLSGPLLDRIDLQVELAALEFDAWARKPMTPVETTAQVRERVAAARLRQRERFAAEDFACNAWLDQDGLRRHCELDSAAMTVLERAAASRHLSARSLDRVLRVARTIADLAGREKVGAGDVVEAAGYRSVERLSRPI
jgi:magnesium chelatase family protein